ncbi:MAG: hypothetical protein VYD87_21910 [Pseudomonadota bacterium]|nr:hypothetical protein [Pseudomonadota bacterium]
MNSIPILSAALPRRSPALAVLASLAALGLAGPAAAHVGGRAMAQLLPTEIWAPAGTAVVALTALALAVAPPAALRGLAGARLRLPAGPRGPGARRMRRGARDVVSCAMALLVAGLVALGHFGSRDPLVNLAPLMLWTGALAILPLAQAAFGDLWAWLNPWTGPARLIRRAAPRLARRWPRGLGRWPAAATWLAFMGFMLADPAPQDPARAATAMGVYAAAMLALTVVFGPRTPGRACGLTVWLGLFASVAPLTRRGGRRALRVPGLGPVRDRALVGAGAVALVALGAGGFDGFNETFRWLALIGVNPLEFPGRSAVERATLLGLAGFAAALAAIWLALAWGGMAAAGGWTPAARATARRALPGLCLALAPIVVAYHIAHYLPVALVQGQYLVAALNDPFSMEVDFLRFHFGRNDVTTGFFNTYAGVRLIWLIQAGAVVAGHVAGVVCAHLAALDALDDPRRAARSQIAPAMFMVVYTLFGLWLLAAPTGA